MFEKLQPSRQIVDKDGRPTPYMLGLDAQVKDALNGVAGVGDVLRVDNNGTNFTGLTSSANNLLKFGHKPIDPNGWYDTSTGIFLPTVAGYYLATLQVLGATGTGGETTQAVIADEGGSPMTYGNYLSASSAAEFTSQASMLVSLDGSTQGLSAYGWAPTGSTVILGFGPITFFQVVRIGG